MQRTTSPHYTSPNHYQQCALDDLREALADRAAELAERLLGKPAATYKNGNELRWGNKGGFTVHIHGPRRGTWVDSQTQKGGDMLSLIMREQGCTFRGALDFARDFVGSTIAPLPPPRRVKPRPPPRDGWKRVWHDSVDPRGTLVEDYLRSRYLMLPDEVAGRTIRYHGSLWRDGSTCPGMVALFTDIHTDEPCGVHRTFLDSDGKKIDRRMLGRAGNAAIKLSADEDVEQGLHVGEGIETCLAAWLAGFRPVWAVGSCGGIARFPLLAGIDAISVLTELNDGGANQQAVEHLRETWAEREVLVIDPLVGDDIADAWGGNHATR
jgi:hypothetical protein